MLHLLCPQATCPGWKLSPLTAVPLHGLLPLPQQHICPQCSQKSSAARITQNTGANETLPCAHIELCTSTPPVPSPEHCSVTSVLPLLPACKGLIQHLNVPQRHILPAPMLAMGNIKHSGDCCYFIIYEALVISYINNPWLQSVAGTAIEYSWGILVENFHHQFKASH